MSPDSANQRPGRGSQREARRAARSQRAAKLPYIRRRIPNVELLSSEAVEVIEHNAETILEEIGIEFRRDPESLRLWREAGADVRGERVRMPRGLCRRLIATAPREFTLHARNPERSVRFGGDATVFSPVGGPPFVSDLDRGRRYGTLEDLHNFIKLAHVAPAIHFLGGCMVEPMDVPEGKRHLDVQYAFFRYSDLGGEGIGQDGVAQHAPGDVRRRDQRGARHRPGEPWPVRSEPGIRHQHRRPSPQHGDSRQRAGMAGAGVEGGALEHDPLKPDHARRLVP